VIIYIFVFVGLAFSSCDSVDLRLTISNKEPNTVSYFLSDSDIDNAASLYSTLFLYNSRGEKKFREFKFIKGKAAVHISTLGNWENVLNAKSDSGEMQLYIIDSVDLGKDKTTLIKNKLIRKYIINLKNLKSNNWVVTIQ